MIGVTWWDRECSELVAQLLHLLVEAASNDPLLERIAGDPRHCHGFGYLAAWFERGLRLTWYRYDAADELGAGEDSCRINLDELAVAISQLAEKVATADAGLLVVHARRAGRREPRGTMHAHPFVHVVPGRNGYLVLGLAHNGGVDKEKLAKLVGVEPSAYTDSHIALLALARMAEQGLPLGRALDALAGYTKEGSALDVLVAMVGSEVSLHAYSYIHPSADEARKEYYRPVFFETACAAGYVSSTLEVLVAKRGLSLGRTWSAQRKLYTFTVRRQYG
jgi:glutamine amidotransferase